jgi:hypothetical protein
LWTASRVSESSRVQDRQAGWSGSQSVTSIGRSVSRDGSGLCLLARSPDPSPRACKPPPPPQLLKKQINHLIETHTHTQTHTHTPFLNTNKHRHPPPTTPAAGGRGRHGPGISLPGAGALAPHAPHRRGAGLHGACSRAVSCVRVTMMTMTTMMMVFGSASVAPHRTALHPLTNQHTTRRAGWPLRRGTRRGMTTCWCTRGSTRPPNAGRRRRHGTPTTGGPWRTASTRRWVRVCIFGCLCVSVCMLNGVYVLFRGEWGTDGDLQMRVLT